MVAFIAEPTQGPWVDNPDWGNGTGSIAMPVEAAQIIPVATLNRAPGPPRVYTVQLQRSDRLQTGNSDLYARIDHACGAQQNSFDLDWIAGTQLSLPATFIRVSAVSYAPDSASAYNAAGQVALSACFGEGAAPTSVPGRASLTLPRRTWANTTVETFLVPDFARAVVVNLVNNDDPAADTDVVLQAENGGGRVWYQGDCKIFAGGMAQGLQLPGATQRIQLQNNTGGDVSATVQFLLAL